MLTFLLGRRRRKPTIWSDGRHHGSADPGQPEPIAPGIEFVAKQKGHWIVFGCVGSPTLPSPRRIDIFKDIVGIDITKMYPAGGPPDKELRQVDVGILPASLEKLPRRDIRWASASASPTTRSRGRRGHECLRRLTGRQGRQHHGQSDATKQVLEWFQKLVPLCPKDAFRVG